MIEQWLGLSNAYDAQKKGEKNKVDRRRKETERKASCAKEKKRILCLKEQEDVTQKS